MNNADIEKLEEINDDLTALAESVGSEIDADGIDDLTYVVAEAMGIDIEQFVSVPKPVNVSEWLTGIEDEDIPTPKLDALMKRETPWNEAT